ncbi:MAG: GTP cyclohydrolase I [Chloroflexi bacterium]|nr:GTP cyclohydrolase I [Chloroflexota bacterium]
MMRGVKKEQASMITSALLGNFKNNPQTRAEFMAHVNRS